MKAILAMSLLVSVLTGIVSGDTQPHSQLNPAVVGFLLLAYSFPLLNNRERAWRWRLRAPHIFFVGLAYGIVNEGLLVQTLVRSEHVPISNFDHYLRWRGSLLQVFWRWASLLSRAELLVLAKWNRANCYGWPFSLNLHLSLSV